LKSDNMTRVSLKEAYDNKDVIAQIYAIRDTAESAVDTSEQAVTTANTASGHVDALVPQVEGAVQNANSASASAQASAQTVAGYENRLGAVETGLSTAQHDITAVEDNVEDLSGDLNAVTLRVTTAEGQIVTIQGRVTALETADGQNVKIDRINDYAVGLTGNQTRSGVLKLTSNYPIRTNPVGGWGIIAVESDGVAPTGSRNYTPIQIDGVNGTLLKITHRSYQDVSSYLSLVFGRMDSNGVFKSDTLEIDSDATRTRLRMARTKNDGSVVYATIAELNEASQ